MKSVVSLVDSLGGRDNLSKTIDCYPVAINMLSTEDFDAACSSIRIVILRLDGKDYNAVSLALRSILVERV